MDMTAPAASPNPISAALCAKISEQMDRLERLASLIPANQQQWRPSVPEGAVAPFAIDRLLGHVLDCLAGFCAALYAADRQRFAHLAALRDLPVNHCCRLDEALTRIRRYRRHIEGDLARITDADLQQVVPTVFVPTGESLVTILLGNLEHLINHKYQLFFYLRLLGIKVGSADLYQFRS